MPSMRFLSLALVLLALAFAGCSSSAEKTPAYEAAQVERPLEVPPDLTRPASRDALQVPDVAPRVAQMASEGPGRASPGEVRLVRDGAQRWLEIDAAPVDIWPRAKAFLRSENLNLAIDDPELGLLETDWREMRSTGFLARLTNRAAGVLDKFRLRLEPAGNGEQTLLFLTHRGMQEVVDDGEEGPTWAYRRPDPELEAEMQQRLLSFLGRELSGEVAGAPGLAELHQQDGAPVLSVAERFPRAWRRTGLALDRVGVIIVDRDRSRGVYYIRLPDSFVSEQRLGRAVPRELRVALEEGNGRTGVRLRASDGGAVAPGVAERFLSQLAEHLG